MRDCIARIVDASRGFDPEKEATLSEKEAKGVLDELNAAAMARVKRGEDFNDALSAEILSKKLESKKQGRIQKRNALINIAKDQELRTKIDDFINAGLDARGAFQALLVGTNADVKGGRLSVDTKFLDTKAKYLGKLNQDLEHEGLSSIIAQKAMEPQIENELWQLSLPQGGQPGITKSPEAQKIAKILHNTMEAIRIRQNQAGAAIDKVAGFTATQTHNISKMWKAGYDEWSQTIMKHLDVERTFGDANKEAFLKGSYEAITTGIHLKAQGADEGKLFQFKGPANLAKKVSQNRVFHFKSAEDARAYREAFGNRDFIEGVLAGVEHGSRNIALMETFGTNPEAMFDKLLQDTKVKYRSNTDKIKSLVNDRMIHNFYKEVDGTTMMVESPSLATAASTIRSLQSLSKLGSVVISSFADIPAKVSELHYQGYGILESYGLAFKDIGSHLNNSSERKQLYSSIGVGFDGMLGHIASRFSSTDSLPGTMSKLQRQFFKLNGLTWWTDANKAGTGLAMSHHLALLKDNNFASLDKDTQRLFSHFDIKEKDWDLIRQSATKQLDDRHYITPDAIHGLPDTMFGKNATAEKNALESKLRGYFVDRVNYATLEPGARERAIYNQGTKRGSVPGELLRMFAQFKQFPTAMITKLYGRGLFAKGKADIPSMVHLAVMSTVFGYGSMVVKDLLKGREPRDPSKAATWGAAFTQGGGAGILGDYLLGEFNRFGQDITTTAAGPAFSTLNDLTSILSAARNNAILDAEGRSSEQKDVKAHAINFMINNAPFANLAYIRPALNYMFIYQLQEKLNPGYLRRMERRVEKENNQHFILPPTSVLK